MFDNLKAKLQNRNILLKDFMPPEINPQNQISSTAIPKNIVLPVSLVVVFVVLIVLALASLSSNKVEDLTQKDKNIPNDIVVNDTPTATLKPSISITPTAAVIDTSAKDENSIPYQKCTTFNNNYVSFTCPQDGYAYAKTFSKDSLAQGVLEINLATDNYQIRIQPFLGGGTEVFPYDSTNPLLIPQYGAGEGELRLTAAPKSYTLANGLKALFFEKDLNDEPGLYFAHKNKGSNEVYIIEKNLVFGMEQLKNLLKWQGTYENYENKPDSVALIIDTKDKMTQELADRIMKDLDAFFKSYRIF